MCCGVAFLRKENFMAEISSCLPCPSPATITYYSVMSLHCFFFSEAKSNEHGKVRERERRRGNLFGERGWFFLRSRMANNKKEKNEQHKSYVTFDERTYGLFIIISASCNLPRCFPTHPPVYYAQINSRGLGHNMPHWDIYFIFRRAMHECEKDSIIRV